MAQAIVPPAEMVSSPSSSQRPLAVSTASGSEMPHIGPSANTFSYSTRIFLPPRAEYMCSQPIVHDAQLLRATRRISARPSAASRGASAKLAAWKFLVGRVLIALKASRLASVRSVSMPLRSDSL